MTMQQVLADLKERDHADMTRAVAPLKQADDAVLVNTTELNFSGSVEKYADCQTHTHSHTHFPHHRIIQLVREKM